MVRLTEARTPHPRDPSTPPAYFLGTYTHLDAIPEKDKVRNRGHITGVRKLGRLVDIGCGHSHAPV